MTRSSILAKIRERARTSPEGTFASFNGESLSFRALDEISDRIAAGLRRIGVARGDRVACMMRNSPFVVSALFGLAKAGAIWVPVNVQLKQDGLRHIIEHSEPKVILSDPDLLPAIRHCGARLEGLTVVAAGGDADFDMTMLVDGMSAFDEPFPRADEPFAIMYTSGTTGAAKGVIVSHSMMNRAAAAVAMLSDARDGDVMFMWEPLYHIGGAQMLALPLMLDIELAMVDRFSASQFWSQVRAAGATHIHYLGGILQILNGLPPSADDRDHKVRVAWGGGCPKDIWHALEARFGFAIRECYGMTEASSISTVNIGGTAGSIGRPVPWFDVAVVDAHGRPAPAGQQGEIVVQAREGDGLFDGYFRNPQATAAALRDGILFTGDLGSRDANGEFWLHGRMTDSVRCRGENVSAWQVEHVASSHPAVDECAMIGVPAEIGEQDIKLFVKLKPGAALSLPAFSEWLAHRLASYQNPRYLVLADDFERTPSQRIMKHKLPKSTDDCWDRLAASRSTLVG